MPPSGGLTVTWVGVPLGYFYLDTRTIAFGTSGGLGNGQRSLQTVGLIPAVMIKRPPLCEEEAIFLQVSQHLRRLPVHLTLGEASVG